MSTGLMIFLVWFSGYLLFTFGYVFIKRVIDKDTFHDTLVYDIYTGSKYGIFSWFTNICVFSVWLTMMLYGIDEYISNKLNKK